MIATKQRQPHKQTTPALSMENDTQTNSLSSFWRSQPKVVILVHP
jgi:hypothetical protein